MKHDVQYFRIWQSKPILEKLFMETTNGKLRRKCKHHIAQMTPFFEDCIDEVKGFMKSHDIEGETIPFDNPDFIEHFEKFLLDVNEMVSYELYDFPEDLMEYADGITGADELIISWLFNENHPKPESEADDGEAKEEKDE